MTFRTALTRPFEETGRKLSLTGWQHTVVRPLALQQSTNDCHKVS